MTKYSNNQLDVILDGTADVAGHLIFAIATTGYVLIGIHLPKKK